MGLGRKIDPEPGRCRRTDGKKWRCSKEAYPDSKYCERHMHRGKNRSRKPVEVLKTTHNTNASSTSTTPSSILSITKNNPALAPTTAQNIFHHHPHQHSSSSSHASHLQQHSFLYHHPPPSRPSSTGLYFQDNNSASLFLDNASCSQNNTDSRYVYGEKEEVDEHAFFNEPSGNMRSFSASSIDDSWNLTPLSISSPSSSKQRNFSDLTNNDSEYSYLQLQSLNDNSKQQQKQDQGFYNDMKCEKFMKLGDKEEPPQQKNIHRFFDEWPPKSRGTWLDLDDKSSTTQLSISIPTSHDFGTFISRNQRGNEKKPPHHFDIVLYLYFL
ncbi:unnamed protein product [Lupinus luteus]|uniref:Growth-regulating factor n=1 Tax=Lupinus luteus TaxID=3873 RepID=A0AAV1XVH1_LUPLU